MIAAETLERVRNALVEEAQTDVVGLWAVVWEVRQDSPDAEVNELMNAVLGVVQEVLEEGRIVAGDFAAPVDGKANFAEWACPPEEAVDRVRLAWTQLGRDPNLGEVVWFVAPSLLPLALAHPVSRPEPSS